MVKKAGTTTWTAAADRTELKENDELKTDAGSSAIIKMDDGSMAKIGPLAKMKMEQLSKSGKDNNTSLDVSIGKSWNRVNKIGDSSFNVKTPTAVAGVRGTFFSAEVDKSSAATFDVFAGSVQVAGKSAPDAGVLVGEHNRTTVAQNGKPSKPTKIPADQEKAGSSGFSKNEYTSAQFDMQISVSPQVVEAGKTSTVSVQIYKDGQPFRSEQTVKLSLSGSAVFSKTGTSEIEAKTNNSGAVSLEITSPTKETVTVSAKLVLKLGKK